MNNIFHVTILDYIMKHIIIIERVVRSDATCWHTHVLGPIFFLFIPLLSHNIQTCFDALI